MEDKYLKLHSDVELLFNSCFFLLLVFSLHQFFLHMAHMVDLQCLTQESISSSSVFSVKCFISLDSDFPCHLQLPKEKTWSCPGLGCGFLLGSNGISSLRVPKIEAICNELIKASRCPNLIHRWVLLNRQRQHNNHPD